jgi:PP-loop superfamily ATP-utilizing enzyme
LEITPERLKQVEEGEAFLRSLGVVGDLRVRHLGASARLEVAPDQLEQVRGRWAEVQAYFEQLGFASVVLDPEGYRRGRMLSLVSAPPV